MKNKSLLLAIMSFALLAVYCYCIYVLYGNAYKNPANADPLDGVLQVLKIGGGLVSAFVISLLASTPPSKQIGVSLVADGASESETNIIASIATTYVFVWLIAGAFCLVTGSLMKPHGLMMNPIQGSVKAWNELTSIGNTWFGLFVGALYSYFGINPTRTK